MGLAQVQQALARLYTDAALRDRFLADPREVGLTFGLSPVEVEQLAQAASQISFFAESLHRKRLNEVNRLLPFTRRLLGRQFGALFLRYAPTYAPHGLRKHQADALAFADFIERRLSVEPLGPPFGADIVRYEAGWLWAAHPDCRWLVRRFRYPIHKLLHALAQNAAPPPQRPTLGIWFRLWPRRSIHHRLLAWP